MRHFMQKKVTCLTQHMSFEKKPVLFILLKITITITTRN